MDFSEMNDSPRMNTVWLYKDLKVSDLQAHTGIAQ